MAEITIPADDARIQYTATEAQTVFPYDFPIFTDTDLEVIQTTVAGVSSTLTITTHYTVDGVGAQGGGNVTLLSGAVLNDTITISRETPIGRTTDFQVSGDYRAETINRELDLLIMMLQQLQRDKSRAILLKTEDGSSDLELPLVSARANQALAFDASGDILMTGIDGVSTLPNVSTNAMLRGNAAGTLYENRTPNEVKGDIGLGNVDNTADTAKPVSTATQTALNAKEPTISGTNQAVGELTLASLTTGTDNTATGYKALNATDTGYNNTATGYQALYQNTLGFGNTATGTLALSTNVNGTFNTATGFDALQSNTFGSSNTATGVDSLRNNSSGIGNTAAGRQSLFENTTGSNNTASGYSSLDNNTTGSYNTANGYLSLFNNTTGGDNTAIGIRAMYYNTTGNSNTAHGAYALYANTTASFNTAYGREALYQNTTGVSNTSTGYQSLWLNTTGSYNTANGYQAINANTTGVNNTAHGAYALYANTTGANNTASGYYVLFSNTTGASNTASGRSALFNNTTGVSNTATGYFALALNTTGSSNTAHGLQSLYSNTTGTNNTATGRDSLGLNTTGANNTANGRSALYSNTTGANNTCIGYNAGTSTSPLNITTQSNRIVLGNNSVTNAYIKVAWTVTSDARDKADIKTLPQGLDYINALRPVSFVWDNRSDYEGERDGSKKGNTVQIGFIAQEVQTVEDSLEVVQGSVVSSEEPDKMGLTETKLIPILTNAVQELSKENDMLKKALSDLEARMTKAGI